MTTNPYKHNLNKEVKLNVSRSSDGKQFYNNIKYNYPQLINLSQVKNTLIVKQSTAGNTTHTIVDNSKPNNDIFTTVNSLSSKVYTLKKQIKSNTQKLDDIKSNVDANNTSLVQAQQVLDQHTKNLEETKPYMEIGNAIFSKLPIYLELSDDIKSTRDVVDYTKCSYGYSKIYTEIDKLHRVGIMKNISKLFITLVGAGGAGGLGYISNNYYYSGGGGGSGAYARRIPIDVVPGHIVHINIGKGGDLSKNLDGEESYIEIVNNGGHVMKKISVNGGKNGHPRSQDDTSIEGGDPGVNIGAIYRNGDKGNSGSITLPSQSNVFGGNGADSGFANGGLGGGHLIDNNIEFIGMDGSFGSGGGGSAPRTNIDLTQKLSGNGGDGYIMIEFAS